MLEDGRVLAPSNAIIPHLADGSNLMPADPFDLGRHPPVVAWGERVEAALRIHA